MPFGASFLNQGYIRRFMLHRIAVGIDIFYIAKVFRLDGFFDLGLFALYSRAFMKYMNDFSVYIIPLHRAKKTRV